MSGKPNNRRLSEDGWCNGGDWRVADELPAVSVTPACIPSVYATGSVFLSCAITNPSGTGLNGPGGER